MSKVPEVKNFLQTIEDLKQRVRRLEREKQLDHAAIISDKKLYLDGDSSDTYWTHNSTDNRIEGYVDNVLVYRSDIGYGEIELEEPKTSLLSLAGTGSSGGWVDLDISSAVDDDVTHVMVQLTFNDSASAGTNVSFWVRNKDDSSSPGPLIVKGNHINSQSNYAWGIIGLDSNDYIQYRLGASGATSANANIYLVGVIRQVT